jgi:uncharacterized protein YccT (UPF0319 family)
MQMMCSLEQDKDVLWDEKDIGQIVLKLKDQVDAEHHFCLLNSPPTVLNFK